MSAAKHSKETDAGSLRRILVIENSFRPGIGNFIEKLFKSDKDPMLDSRVVDAEDVEQSLAEYKPDVVILDVDSLRHANALDVALSVREQFPHQVIVFSSDRANPVLVKEGMVAALWSRAYWLNQPSKHHAHVLPEIRWAFHGKKPLKSKVLEHPADEPTHIGRLTPQQHRVMRLMSMGASNSKIAKDCKMTTKAVERTIAAASKLLEVEPSSPDTNHRVIAAMVYRRSVLFNDVLESEAPSTQE